jgi:hypothetical protein
MPAAAALTAEAVARGHRLDLHLVDDLVVDVELELADRLVVLPGALLREGDADDVRPGRRGVDGQLLLGRDPEEVVDVRQLPVLDEQRVAAEA